MVFLNITLWTDISWETILRSIQKSYTNFPQALNTLRLYKHKKIINKNMVFDVRTLVQPFTHYCNRSLMSLQFSKRFYTIDDHNNLTLKSETFWSTPDISLLPKVHCIYCVLSLETSSQPDNQELIQETTLLINTKLLS